MSFLRKAVNLAEKATEVGAGILGGPAAGAMATAAINKVDKGNRPQPHGPFTPSSAGSLDEARSQDKSRMAKQYPGYGDTIEF